MYKEIKRQTDRQTDRTLKQEKRINSKRQTNEFTSYKQQKDKQIQEQKNLRNLVC